MRRHILFCLLVFELNFKYFACKQPLTIAKFKPIEKELPISNSRREKFMVLTPMLFHFKKARGCILGTEVNCGIVVEENTPPRGNAAVGVLFFTSKCAV